jgi:hypothetical protein
MQPKKDEVKEAIRKLIVYLENNIHRTNESYADIGIRSIMPIFGLCRADTVDTTKSAG